jgi:hypothetical protein
MDIMAVYRSLSPEDRAIYQQIRTDMRKVYINAHTNVVGMDYWLIDDDYFLDLIDIKVAVLFDRAGHIQGVKLLIDKEEEKKQLDEEKAKSSELQSRLKAYLQVADENSPAEVPASPMSAANGKPNKVIRFAGEST